jgi:hypothetical protein
MTLISGDSSFSSISSVANDQFLYSIETKVKRLIGSDVFRAKIHQEQCCSLRQMLIPLF